MQPDVRKKWLAPACPIGTVVTWGSGARSRAQPLAYRTLPHSAQTFSFSCKRCSLQLRADGRWGADCRHRRQDDDDDNDYDDDDSSMQCISVLHESHVSHFRCRQARAGRGKARIRSPWTRQTVSRQWSMESGASLRSLRLEALNESAAPAGAPARAPV